jgi:hypothetical protein
MDRSKHLEILRAAFAWGTSRERPAWSRTLARIDRSAGLYRQEDLDAEATRAVQAVNDRIEAWFDRASARLEDKSHIADLEQPLEDVWCSMVCMNEGIFDYEPENDLLSPLITTIPSTVPGQGPLYLYLNLDGWGIEPPPEIEPAE